MRTFDLIMLLLAAVFFALAAFGVPAPRAGWPAWLPLGLLAWVLVPLAHILDTY